ncbi:MAG: tetratricopeptide repeat protein, partial [Deltaproteobacteria bacterium]
MGLIKICVLVLMVLFFTADFGFGQDYETYMDRGIEYLEKGQYDKAALNFTKAIELAPEDDFAFEIRGLAYQNKGQYDKAISDFT